MSEIVEMEQTCGNCPVQFEGRLDDGRWFYFRARGSACSLGVGATLDDAVGDEDATEIGHLDWQRDPYGFGWMPVDLARLLIPWMLISRERSWEDGAPPPPVPFLSTAQEEDA